MEICKNAASNNNKRPLRLGDAQKIVSSLNEIWDKMVTFIREQESPMNNQSRNDLYLNPDAGMSSCNNHEIDETHQEEENKSRDIIKISDDGDDSKKPKNKGTTVTVCEAINENTNSDIDSETQNKLRILNDITIKLARSISKNVSNSTNPPVSSLAPSSSPSSASKLVERGTSNLSDQKPISNAITQLNLLLPKNTEIFAVSRSFVQRSSVPSLISQKALIALTTTSIRKQESPLNNQSRNDPCLNPVAGTSSCNNHEKTQEEMNSERNPNGIPAKNASNDCNTSTINTDNSRGNIKGKEINYGTLKTKNYNHRKEKVCAKKSKKSTDSNNTNEVHVNTVKFVAENELVTKAVTTSSKADGEKSKCIQPSKRKGSTDNVNSKKRRLAEVVAQKIMKNHASNKEHGNPDDNGGGFGVEIDCNITKEVDLSEETHQQAMESENLNKTEKENKSRDIIEISDDENDSIKPTNKETTLKVCDVINKKTNGNIDGGKLDKIVILNDITIKLARPISKHVSISTNPSVSSLAANISPLSASIPVESNFSDLKPNVSLSHVTTPLNLPIPKITEIFVASKSQKSLAHTSTPKPSPQGSTLSPQQPPISLLTPGTIVPCQSYFMNLLPSSTPSKTPVTLSPSPTPVADKPSLTTVNQRKHLSALPQVEQRPSRLSTSPLARCDSPVAMQPVPSSTAFTAERQFAAPSHFNTPLNLPLFRSALSVTSISSLQKSSTQSDIDNFRRELTRIDSPTEDSIQPHQPPKTWHTPVTLTSETSHRTPNAFVQESSRAASSFEAYLYKQRSHTLAHSVILTNPEISNTLKSPVQKPSIPPQAVQGSWPAPMPIPNYFDSVTAFRERSTPPFFALIQQQFTRPGIPSSVQRDAPGPMSRKFRSNFPARSPMFYMPIRPPMPRIPSHPETVHRARPNLLPGATLDVSIRGTPSIYDPNFATNQDIDNIVTEYCYNSLLMSLPCVPNEAAGCYAGCPGYCGHPKG